MINHPYDNYLEVITPSGIELFHAEGRVLPFGKIDSEGNVKILADDGIYRSPSQLNSNNPRDRRNLAKFAAYLGRDLEMTNKGIKIVSEMGDELSSKNPAWTRNPPGTEINLNRNGGFSESLDNVNNFKSILKHEILHVDDFMYKINHPNIGSKNKLVTHADVYIKAANDPTYNNTTPDFRKGNAASFANYLLNMDTSPDISITPSVIVNKMNEFNNNNGDIKVDFYDYYGQKGSLKLEIKYKDVTISNMIIITPINE